MYVAVLAELCVPADLDHLLVHGPELVLQDPFAHGAAVDQSPPQDNRAEPGEGDGGRVGGCYLRTGLVPFL